jgi:hypothetical protein
MEFYKGLHEVGDNNPALKYGVFVLLLGALKLFGNE